MLAGPNDDIINYSLTFTPRVLSRNCSRLESEPCQIFELLSMAARLCMPTDSVDCTYAQIFCVLFLALSTAHYPGQGFIWEEGERNQGLRHTHIMVRESLQGLSGPREETGSGCGRGICPFPPPVLCAGRCLLIFVFPPEFFFLGGTSPTCIQFNMHTIHTYIHTYIHLNLYLNITCLLRLFW